MGSCISKCRPKTKLQQEFENVQDKLVISKAPTSPIPVKHVKPASPSPSPSLSSFSSFSCTTSNTSSSSSSSSSSTASSSVFTSKDRSFSNEFLWSCVKENPHIICTDPIKESPVKSEPSKFHPPKLVSPAKSSSVVAPAKHAIPQRAVGSTPQKRVRASSPVLVRQKSFRREPERPNSAYSLPSRTLRSSPSPSRRFEGDKCRVMLTNSPKESVCQRSVSLKGNPVNSSLSSVRKGSGNLTSASPNNNPSRHRPCLRNKEMCSSTTHPIGCKIDEIAVGQVLSHLGIDSLPIEDIDNPLISLDCFIFL